MMPFLEKYKVQTIADLFCGSGSMSKIFYQNYNVVSNDIMAFASIVTSAQLSSHSEEYAKWIEHLNKVPNVEGFITKEYSPKGPSKRMFFTEDTALKIDGMRIELEKNGTLSYWVPSFIAQINMQMWRLSMVHFLKISKKLH